MPPNWDDTQLIMTNLDSSALASYITRSKPQFSAKQQPQFLLQVARSTFIPTPAGLDLGFSGQYRLKPSES